MNQRVSSRHESDLGGRFLPFGDVNKVGVTIVIGESDAHLPCVQHTAWMLVNTLARFEGVVHEIGLICPEGVKLSGRVVPLVARDIDLGAALVSGGNAIGVVPVKCDLRLERTVVVGRGNTDGRADLYVLGSGWCGGISSTPGSFAELNLSSPLPFGPYVAACIAAGEVFKAARMQPGTCNTPSAAFYSVWNNESSERANADGPLTIGVKLDATLVGVGAVGAAVVHCLWAAEDVTGSVALLDNDPKGIETTNLNRYSLFGSDSIGKAKASCAAEIASDASVKWIPHNVAIETFSLSTPHVVSAVDRNTARAAIQFQYPARLFSGSTMDLRAEVLRCGPPGVGACLRCFNEPEKMAPDEVLRAKLKAANDDEISQMAFSAGITIEEAKEWLATGKCGTAGERLLPLLRQDDGESAFAVAFVSVMSGTMLAAELIKDNLASVQPSSDSLHRAIFQFVSQLSRANRASFLKRDPKCPMCDAGNPATGIWAKRFAAQSVIGEKVLRDAVGG